MTRSLSADLRHRTIVAVASGMTRRAAAVRFAPSTIWRCLDRHDMTVKKNGARQQAGTARRRTTARGLVRQ